MTTAAESSIAWADGALLAIDQRALPHDLCWLRLTGVDDVIDAITTLAIRGAPALGVAGGFGAALAAYAHIGDTEKVTSEAHRIASARPTAVNLAWGVRRALARLPAGPDAVLAEAEQMLAEDADVNRVLATHAADLVLRLCPDRPLRVLTHCNTGRLATTAFGTALGAVRVLHARGRIAELGPWLIDNQGRAAKPVIADSREWSGRVDAGPAEVAEILCGWLDSDVKAPLLKAAQGLVCAEGFRNGELHGEFFDDVPAVLASWHAEGIKLYVYSSGSVRNQQDWFAYARGGELAPLISGWFDLANAGAKRDGSSYDTIAEAIGHVPHQILFLSGHPDELDAAAAAGWSVLGVVRSGEPNIPRRPHRWVSSFDEISLSGR